MAAESGSGEIDRTGTRFRRPIGIDLFAGAGGLSLGFEQAGFDVACAVDADPVHCAAHAFNFPRTPVVCADVERLSWSDLRARAGIGDETPAVVFGGPPCQGFSVIGKRSLDDPRNSLVRHFMRLVLEISPLYFVLENVRGLAMGEHRRFLDELVEGFADGGYDVTLPWRVLDAASYGVPQRRQRLFLMGARCGHPLPSYPAPCLAGSAPTVADAIGDLPDVDLIADLAVGDSASMVQPATSSYVALLRGHARDPDDLSHPRAWDRSILTSSMATAHTESTRERFAAVRPGVKDPVSRFLRLDPKGICNTLRAGTGRERGSFTAARPIHPFHERCITVREMARLHSFPDWFRFNVTKWHGARQVGNSVPPLLGRAVAGRIISAMGIRPPTPSHVIGLGDPALLQVDRSAAMRLLASLEKGRNNVDETSRGGILAA